MRVKVKCSIVTRWSRKVKSKIMNDTIHHDGKGGFETESFRAKQKEFNKKRGIIHFLDTPEGKDWFKVEEWKKAHKANKTNK